VTGGGKGDGGNIWTVGTMLWSLNEKDGKWKQLSSESWSKSTCGWASKGEGYIVSSVIYQLPPTGGYKKFQTDDWSTTISGARCGANHAILVTKAGNVYALNLDDAKYTKVGENWASTTRVISYKDQVIIFCNGAYKFSLDGKYEKLGDATWSKTVAACVVDDMIYLVDGVGLFSLSPQDGSWNTLASSNWGYTKALIALEKGFLVIGPQLWTTDCAGNSTKISEDSWSSITCAFDITA